MLRISYLLLVIVLLFSCQKQKQSKAEAVGGNEMKIKIASTTFGEGEMIPKKYTCDGEDISPPLAFNDVPESAKTLALVCDDPDAPMGTWVHWVVFNLPGEIRGITEATKSDDIEKLGGKQGINSFRKNDYGGPCPPSGTHRYYFKVYALDTKLELSSTATKEELLKAMKGHILREGQLMGRYSR